MRRRPGLALAALALLVAGCASQPPSGPTAGAPVSVPGEETTPRSAYQADLENRVTASVKTAVGLDTVWVSDGPRGSVLIGLLPAALFNSQGAVLRGSALGALAQIAALLHADPYAVVQILGPRPTPGSACPSYRLSDRQADALASYWLQLGFPPTRLRYQGRDEDCSSAGQNLRGLPPEWGHLQLLVRPLVAGGEAQAYRPLEVP